MNESAILNIMKRGLYFLTLLLIPSLLFSASQIGKESLVKRDDLFNGTYELEHFNYLDSLTQDEEEFYKNVEIELITTGPGTLLWENFGHSSFLVRMDDNTEFMFDYGIFSFDEDFYKNFALGRLYYEVWETWADIRKESFIEDDRTLETLPLELTTLEKANLIDFLTYNASEGNNTYLYDYFFDNCSTRLRDIYNSITGGKFREWAESIPLDETLRSLSIKYMSRSSFPVVWAVNYLLGKGVDEKITLWDAMFLPDFLNTAISKYQNTDVKTIYKSVNRDPVPSYYPFYLYSLLLALCVGLIALLCQTKRRSLQIIGDTLMSLIYLILFAMSLVLCFFMFFSIHSITYYNTNALVISPIMGVFLALHIYTLFKPEKGRRLIRKLANIMFFITLILLVIKGIFLTELYIDNLAYYTLVLVIYLVESRFLTKLKEDKIETSSK